MSLNGRVLVGIVFHSGVDDLASCLASLVGHTLRQTLVVVIADVSPNGNARELAKLHGAIWLDGARNAGYAWALHLVADRYLTPTDVFLCCNSDIQFLPGALERLIELASGTEGVYYPLQVDEAGQPVPHCVQPQLSLRSLLTQWSGIGRRHLRARGIALIREAAERHVALRLPPGTYGSGAVIAMASGIWRKTGGLDRRFFLYSEDKSFGTCLERSEIPAFLCGDVVVMHPGGTLSRGIRAEATIESMVSEQLNWGKLHGAGTSLVVAVQVIALLGRICRSTISRRPSEAKEYATALRFRIAHRRLSQTARRGSDGYRLPAYDRSGSSEVNNSS